MLAIMTMVVTQVKSKLQVTYFCIGGYSILTDGDYFMDTLLKPFGCGSCLVMCVAALDAPCTAFMRTMRQHFDIGFMLIPILGRHSHGVSVHVCALYY